MKRMMSNIRYILYQSNQAKRSFVFVSLFVYSLRVVTALTSVLGLKFIFDALTLGKDFLYLVFIVLCYCLLQVGKGLLDAWYQESYLPVASLAISRHLDLQLMRKTSSLDLAAFDDADFFDQYTRAKNEITSRIVAGVQTLCDMVGCGFSMAALSLVIFTIEPVLLLCVAAGVFLSFFTDLFRARLYYRYELETTKEKRKIDYIRRIFYEPQYLVELRLFPVKELGMKKYRASSDCLEKILRRQGRNKTLISWVNVLLEKGVFVMSALLFLGWRVWNGVLSVGDFSAMFSAVFNFGNELYAFVSKFPEMYRHSLFIENLRNVMEAEENIEISGEIELDTNKSHSIEFQDVSFSYPNGREALRHINMKIQAGEKVAIVGYNGAGKSTLMKLLCRLYEPQGGHIYIDGRDIREYTVGSLRSAFGIVMQDFHHYAFTVAENICPQGTCTQEEIWRTLKGVDMEERVRRMPHGIQSSLTKEFDSNGVILSGGEFQKLSIARAKISDPPMMILDEVTSALDPVAEARLNDALLKGNENKTVLFISHRLNSVQYADKVFLFEKGNLVENGTHTELLKANGIYAMLFHLQAQKYGE